MLRMPGPRGRSVVCLPFTGSQRATYEAASVPGVHFEKPRPAHHPGALPTALSQVLSVPPAGPAEDPRLTRAEPILPDCATLSKGRPKPPSKSRSRSV